MMIVRPAVMAAGEYDCLPSLFVLTAYLRHVPLSFPFPISGNPWDADWDVVPLGWGKSVRPSY